MKKINCVLSIAGSDSGAGAGIQADMKSVAACGGYCTTAITAITAQNTVGVRSIEILSDKIVEQQIDAVMQDFNITAIKLGMLPSLGIVDIVARTIQKYNIENVVLDPVMVATSGDMLVSEDVANHIIQKLLPLCRVITPNIPESEFITKIKINSTKDYDKVSKWFADTSCKAVLLKSGHLDSDLLTDYLFDFENNTQNTFAYKKINTPNTHGTGCSLSSSIAAYLSNDYSLPQSVQLAEEFLHKAIENANYKIGEGHGSINHFYSTVR